MPPELIELILSFIEEDQKTNLRLVNSVWFDIIKKSYFRIGCIFPKEIDEVVACFSRYTNLIGLRFDKTYKLSPKDLEPIFSLTNLTSLEVYPLHAKQMSKASVTPFETNIRKPTTNLQQLTIAHLNICDIERIPNVTKLVADQIPSDSGIRTQLVSIQTSGCLTPFIITNTNLTTLEADYNTEMALECFPALKELRRGRAEPHHDLSKCFALETLELQKAETNIPASVTSLTVLSFFKQKWITHPGTLKRLAVTGIDSTSRLTALEKLQIYNTLHMTAFEDIRSLLALKELSIKLVYSNQTQNLTHLHNLENLSIDYEFNDGSISVEPLMSLTRLTALRFNSFVKVFGFEHLSKLTNLQRLVQLAKLTEDVNVSNIYALTRLTSLTWKSPVKFYSANMTYLRELHLSPQGNHVANFNLPSVTSLSISVDNTNSFWRCVSTLTSLRELTLYKLMDGTKLLHFTALRHLTLLTILAHQSKGYTITALTRLQQIYISPPIDWSKSFIQEVHEKLPYLEQLESFVSSRVD